MRRLPASRTLLVQLGGGSIHRNPHCAVERVDDDSSLEFQRDHLPVVTISDVLQRGVPNLVDFILERRRFRSEAEYVVGSNYRARDNRELKQDDMHEPVP